jgi:hypothetical protein
MFREYYPILSVVKFGSDISRSPYAPAFTGAASSVSGSMAVAGLAALGALIFA